MKSCIKIIDETTKNERKLKYSISLTKREIDLVIRKLDLTDIPKVSYEILSIEETEKEISSLLIDDYFIEKFLQHSNKSTHH